MPNKNVNNVGIIDTLIEGLIRAAKRNDELDISYTKGLLMGAIYLLVKDYHGEEINIFGNKVFVDEEK